MAVSIFTAALDVILTTQGSKCLDGDSIRSLRLACKGTRQVVDFHIQTFNSRSYLEWQDPDKPHWPTRDDHTGFVFEITPWPWANLSTVILEHRRRHDKATVQKEVEYLVNLPLPGLKNLTIQCFDIMPLVEKSNWPLLQELDLRVLNRDYDISYPVDLHFPRWPLKKLKLNADNRVIRLNAPHEFKFKCAPPNSGFVGPLLSSCPDLNELRLEDDLCTEEVASIINKAPLIQLTKLDIRFAKDKFYSTLFERDWSTLKYLWTSDIALKEDILPLLASQTWLVNLETLSMGEIQSPTATELRSFLKVLEQGGIKELSLCTMQFPLQSSTILQGFRGIQFNRLKSLYLEDAFDFDGIDDSDFVNSLFDSSLFPKLEELAISQYAEYNIIQENDVDFNPLSGWLRPPRQETLRVPPKLTKISLTGLHLSRDTLDYLGELRRRTGCEIDHAECFVYPIVLPLNRQELLNNLAFDLELWNEYCRDHSCLDDYKDCMLWNIMSDDKFTKVIFNAACTNAIELGSVSRLRRLLICYKLDPEGSGLATDQVATAEGLLKGKLESRINCQYADYYPALHGNDLRRFLVG